MCAQLRENLGFKKSTLNKIDHLDVCFMTFKYLGFNIEKRDSGVIMIFGFSFRTSARNIYLFLLLMFLQTDEQPSVHQSSFFIENQILKYISCPFVHINFVEKIIIQELFLFHSKDF